ncbi:hypothetical protein C2845_PM11G06790 [Panicum miliaceum]|uniref:Uncharacterized protein n=1 Tax=Panicum miliaceum TaxID=4540 RepID=A0A3L6RMU5_PANMI|nr:hypothetical protein C2845_PM11G06790 [Panicum miliaceum]
MPHAVAAPRHDIAKPSPSRRRAVAASRLRHAGKQRRRRRASSTIGRSIHRDVVHRYLDRLPSEYDAPDDRLERELPGREVQFEVALVACCGRSRHTGHGGGHGLSACRATPAVHHSLEKEKAGELQRGTRFLTMVFYSCLHWRSLRGVVWPSRVVVEAATTMEADDT